MKRELLEPELADKTIEKEIRTEAKIFCFI